jgi:hypothetical protein
MHGLLLSLSGILFLFIVIGFYCLYRLKKSVNKLIFYASVLVLPLIGYFSITNIPQIEGEWHNAKWYADEYLKSPEAFVKSRVYPMSGTEVRIVMWTAAVKAIQKHPLGVGTGNVDEYLAKELNQVAITLTWLESEKLDQKNWRFSFYAAMLPYFTMVNRDKSMASWSKTDAAISMYVNTTCYK